MKKWAVIFGCLCAVALLALGLPLLIGVWLPDLVGSSKHTLAEQRTPDGHTFRVIQYWNHCDFYNTELHHSFPDGRTEIEMLDADDGKEWSVPLEIEEATRRTTITLSGNRRKIVNW